MSNLKEDHYVTLRANLLQELQKLRSSREKPFPLQTKRKTTLKQSQKDKLLDEARQLLEKMED